MSQQSSSAVQGLANLTNNLGGSSDDISQSNQNNLLASQPGTEGVGTGNAGTTVTQCTVTNGPRGAVTEVQVDQISQYPIVNTNVSVTGINNNGLTNRQSSQIRTPTNQATTTFTLPGAQRTVTTNGSATLLTPIPARATIIENTAVCRDQRQR